MNNLPRHINFSPPQVLVLGFAVVIMLGTFLLMLPASTVAGEKTAFLEALFTATSAVCVTGLVVVDTGSHFTMFGQIIIMLLIQVGGLGFMTVATLFALLMGKRINLKERLLIQQALNQVTMEGVVRLSKYILMMTFLLEGIGAVLLGLKWIPEMGLAKAFYYGLFHSVSAFNNAGFDLFGTSLTGYTTDLNVNMIISSLFIIGGLGFTVVVDLVARRRWKHFSLHTKLVLTVTGVLILFGTLAVFALEYSNNATLGQLKASDKFLASYFQSVTARTAGFNTIDTAELRHATQFLIIIFMFIGASPGSTGGGIKTATFGTLIAAVRAMAKGHLDVEIFRRRIPKELVYRALTVVFAALTWVIAVAMFLSITEQADFLALLFEATSAFGTVGLTMGVTSQLSAPGKIAIILTMFIGRLGPLTLVYALGQRAHKSMFRYPEEKIIIGS